VSGWENEGSKSDNLYTPWERSFSSCRHGRDPPSRQTNLQPILYLSGPTRHPFYPASPVLSSMLAIVEHNEPLYSNWRKAKYVSYCIRVGGNLTSGRPPMAVSSPSNLGSTSKPMTSEFSIHEFNYNFGKNTYKGNDLLVKLPHSKIPSILATDTNPLSIDPCPRRTRNE
jgi:hypothetical protein